MVPRSRGAEFLESCAQLVAHGDDAAGHGLQVVLPLSKELGVVEDGRSNTGAIQGRVGDFGSLENGQLGANAGDGGAGVRSGAGHKVEASSSLAIEAKVLGETLANDSLKSLLNKVADGGGILGEVARSEALVGTVEEGEMLLLSDNDSQLLPLVEGRVDTGRVMGARVQQDNGTLGSSLDGSLHALKVEAIGLLGEVRVVGNLETDVSKDLLVVSPGRVG